MKTHSGTNMAELQAILNDPNSPYRARARCALQLRHEELRQKIVECAGDQKRVQVAYEAEKERSRIGAALMSLYGIV
jgi:hypothetical protein